MIRRADNKDIERITEVIRQANQVVADRLGLTPENCPKHPSNCVASWIEASIARGIQYYVYESNHEMVGCVALEKVDEETCYLERLAVLPRFQKQGIGSTLLNHFFDEAMKLEVKRVSIGTIAENKELTKWYEKHGCVRGATKTFAHLPFTVLFIEKKL